jgi:RNA polymerase sigma factor for flagellar operon FliA
MPYAASEPRHELLWDDLRERRDPRARQALVSAHLELVHVVVHRMLTSLPRHVDARDLYGAGLVGLLQAIDQFDATRGIGFATFATPRIRGAVLDELRSQDWLPRRLRRQAREIDATHARLENERGRAVSWADVAEALQVSASELESLVHEIRVRQPVSLDEAPRPGSTDAPSPLDSLADPESNGAEERLAQEERRRDLARAFRDLPERERTILQLHYFEGRRLREIGSTLGVSESRVSQLHGQALTRLRSRLRASGHEHSSEIALAELASVDDEILV